MPNFIDNLSLYLSGTIFLIYAIRRTYWTFIYYFKDKCDADKESFNKMTDAFSFLLLALTILSYVFGASITLLIHEL